MSVTIPLKEVIAEWMKEPGFAEAREQARREFAEELAAERVSVTRALFPYRKNRVRAKEKPAFTLQRKRVVA